MRSFGKSGSVSDYRKSNCPKKILKSISPLNLIYENSSLV
jgi:hypothetical protein